MEKQSGILLSEILKCDNVVDYLDPTTLIELLYWARQQLVATCMKWLKEINHLFI